VWRLAEDRALVATTDFFTPVVDDAYDFGAIAAANALSDVYAMGGQPFLALNIAALPPDLPADITSEILRGGAETARQAGVVIGGGHTVQDKEPKYGLVVLGFVDPGRMFTKGSARPGEVLVLSKPLGFGVTTTALKQGKADPGDVVEVTGWMKHLNKTAAELALEVGVCAATDITGYSLLGHGYELASTSSVGLQLSFSKLPFTSRAKYYAGEWTFPGGASDNRHYYQPHVTFAPEIDEPSQMLLYDPQTSGGLLLCVSPGKIGFLLERAEQAGQPVWVVGEVTEGRDIIVTL